MKVVVIGAGIVGTSTALTLAERGIEVVVLERGIVAGEASGLNAGLIGGGGWGREPDLGVTLKMGSREMFIDLSDTRGHDIGLDLTGTLTLIRSQSEWEWAEAAVSADQEAGRSLELVGQRDLQQLEPSVDPGLLGAILDPFGARAEPVATTQALAAEARLAGATIETHTTVTSLRPVASGWELGVEVERAGPSGSSRSTSSPTSRTLGADAVVVAAGPWCAELGAMVGTDIPIVAVRGQMWATEAQPAFLRHGITAAESPSAWRKTSLAEGEPPDLTHRQGRRLTRHLYGRQRPNGELVFGGDRVLTAERSVDEEGIGVNHQHVGELLPAVSALRRARTWTGLMPFSLNGQPVIGQVPDQPGLFVAGGLASSGFGRGPMTGRLVADLVSDTKPPVELSL